MEELHGEVDALEVSAGGGQVAGLGGAGGDDEGVVFVAQFSRASVLTPTWALVTKVTPSAVSRSTRRLDGAFVELHVGDAVHEQVRRCGRARRSKTVTVWPAALSCAAAARPAGPEPMTATFLPVRDSGGRLGDDPAFLRKPRSTMAHFSMSLMVTGGSVMPRTQARPRRGRGARRGRRCGTRESCWFCGGGRGPRATGRDRLQVVPLGDEVVHGAARGGLAEWDAAVHAAGALRPELLLVGVLVELVEGFDALDGVDEGDRLALEFEKSRGLTHGRCPPCSERQRPGDLSLWVMRRL